MAKAQGLTKLTAVCVCASSVHITGTLVFRNCKKKKQTNLQLLHNVGLLIHEMYKLLGLTGEVIEFYKSNTRLQSWNLTMVDVKGGLY